MGAARFPRNQGHFVIEVRCGAWRSLWLMSLQLPYESQGAATGHPPVLPKAKGGFVLSYRAKKTSPYQIHGSLLSVGLPVFSSAWLTFQSRCLLSIGISCSSGHLSESFSGAPSPLHVHSAGAHVLQARLDKSQKIGGVLSALSVSMFLEGLVVQGIEVTAVH